MDFALLPPEVNSARLYAGPGSQPLVAAALAWDGLSAELRAAGAFYGSVIEELTAGSWLGPASASMAAGAGPYVEWMVVTAAQAEQAAIQAKAAAAAYEVAFAAAVPPPVIAANRAQLTALVATNIFGQNTAAIAVAETHYAQMWAQDAMAMYGYAGVSASATALTPFSLPPQSVNTDGLGAQAAAVAHSAATATSNTQTMLAHVTSAVPAALQGLASPATGTSAAGLPSLLTSLASITPETVVSTTLEVSDVSVGTSGLVTASGAWVDAAKSDDAIHDTAVDWHENAKNQLREIMARFDQLGTVASTDSSGLDYEAPSAQVGEAASVGRLSVPQGWTEAAPAMRLAAAGLPTASFGAAPAALVGSVGGAGSVFSELALAGIAGRALSGPLVPGARERAAAAGDHAAPGKRSSRSPGPSGSPGDPSMGIAAEIREFAEVLGRLGELRASGLLTEEEFAEQKQRLLGR